MEKTFHQAAITQVSEKEKKKKQAKQACISIW